MLRFVIFCNKLFREQIWVPAPRRGAELGCQQMFLELDVV